MATSRVATAASLTLGENILTGQVLTLDSAGDAIRADATFSTDAWRPAAVARVGGSTGATISVGLSGELVPILFGAAPGAAANGSPVFLSTIAGEGTLTPPLTSGNVVYVIGILQGADGASTTPSVVFQPQYISRIP